MLLLLLVPVVIVLIAVSITFLLLLAVVAYVCWHHLLHALRDPVLERYEDICSFWFAESRRKILLNRLWHLKCQQFHPYYHGSKPSSTVLFQGLITVCDWWRQQPSGMPATCMVYLRLTCKTLAETESLAARQLTIRAPLIAPNPASAVTYPARRWKAVQAVFYMHRPEQLPALMSLAAAWPNLRQLHVTKPRYMSWRLGDTSGSSSSSVADVTGHPGSSSTLGAVTSSAAAAALAASPTTGELLAQLQAALVGTAAPAPAAAVLSSSSLVSSVGGSSFSSPLTSSSSHGTAATAAAAAAAARLDGPVLHLVAGIVLSASHWPYLHSLSLSHIGLTAAAAHLLAHAAQCWPLLRICNVSYNSLGASGVLVLLEAAMNSWHQLQTLDFQGDKGLAVGMCSADGTGSTTAEHQQQQQQLQQWLLSHCAAQAGDDLAAGRLVHPLDGRSSSNSNNSNRSSSSSSSRSSRQWMVVTHKQPAKPPALHDLSSQQQLPGGHWGLSSELHRQVHGGWQDSSTGRCASWQQQQQGCGASCTLTQALCSSCTAPQQLPLLLLL